jgi:hypothetical protein
LDLDLLKRDFVDVAVTKLAGQVLLLVGDQPRCFGGLLAMMPIMIEG